MLRYHLSRMRQTCSLWDAECIRVEWIPECGTNAWQVPLLFASVNNNIPACEGNNTFKGRPFSCEKKINAWELKKKSWEFKNIRGMETRKLFLLRILGDTQKILYPGGPNPGAGGRRGVTSMTRCEWRSGPVFLVDRVEPCREWKARTHLRPPA